MDSFEDLILYDIDPDSMTEIEKERLIDEFLIDEVLMEGEFI